MEADGRRAAAVLYGGVTRLRALRAKHWVVIPAKAGIQ